MDAITFITSVVSSLGLSTATAAWLAREWIGQRLKKDLAEHKSTLDRARDEWQSGLRQEVELALGAEAAEREYRSAARRRLYEAIGPLCFQLLLACRQLADRIQSHGINPKPYDMDVAKYYGRSTLYRLLRPIAISDLIERQMAFADFAVDPEAAVPLRFRRALFQGICCKWVRSFW
jgi:hypothetical protein